MRYLITDTPGGPVIEHAAPPTVGQRVDELSGRPGAQTFLRQLRRNGDRVYIAANRGGERRGRGFIVELIVAAGGNA